MRYLMMTLLCLSMSVSEVYADMGPLQNEITANSRKADRFREAKKEAMEILKEARLGTSEKRYKSKYKKVMRRLKKAKLVWYDSEKEFSTCKGGRALAFVWFPGLNLLDRRVSLLAGELAVIPVCNSDPKSGWSYRGESGRLYKRRS